MCRPPSVGQETPREAALAPDSPAEADPGQVQAYLEHPLADALCVTLFSGGAVGFSETLWMLSPLARGAMAVGLTLLGLLACAIERGRIRPLSVGAALALSAVAASAHLGLLALGRADPGDLLARGVAILLVGTVLARAGRRFDRGETGWRQAVRIGPPTGSTPLALRIAGLCPPRPLSFLLLPLLPAALLLRTLCLLAILGYQLTLSRLMPPACRYEPSCSRYGFQAYLRHGCLQGSLLTTIRLIRCSPIGSGGYDPVPDTIGNGVWWNLRAKVDDDC